MVSFGRAALRGYGHDNLRVFGSVGVGTLKGWDAEKRKMVHITDFKRREARILADGPIRTVVEMRVEGWRYGGREITMTSRYILYAGHGDGRSKTASRATSGAGLHDRRDEDGRKRGL